jgi:copper(I)-binding protein
MVVLGTPDIEAHAGDLRVSGAWTAASGTVGADVPLLMTITNDSATPDALLRVRCPFANFSERHTIDRGEGAPAMRAIRSIPIPANQTIELKPDGYHVMLLQTREALAAGETLHCSVTFQHAGPIETEVKVRGLP